MRGTGCQQKLNISQSETQNTKKLLAGEQELAQIADARVSQLEKEKEEEKKTKESMMH